MRRAVFALGLAVSVAGAFSATASTFYPEKMKCPIGGERFMHNSLASISTFGSLPDGMPIGSGIFPVQLPQCPGNGLVMYRNFTAAEVKKLAPLIGSAEYQALRKTETLHYLAYRLALALGDDAPAWLLLQGNWEAKNEAPGSERAKRYAEEFVTLVRGLPLDPGDFTSIALRARAANALRELGRFDEAETVRAAIAIAADAGGSDSSAAENREGWRSYLAALAAPIARRDSKRAPIDMMGAQEAVFRCLQPERRSEGEINRPLTSFEQQYCERPELAQDLARARALPRE